jgi:hypothetical protein
MPQQTGPNPPAASDKAATGEQPNVLQEKFGGDVNKLATSYSAAESELGRLRAQIAELQKGSKPADQQQQTQENNTQQQQQQQQQMQHSSPEEMDKAAMETAKAAGLDYSALTEKFTKTGKIDDSDYAAFAKIGIPRNVVNQFIDNAKAAAQSGSEAILKEVGLSANFEDVAKWAGNGGYTKEQAEAYNRAVTSGDPGQVKQALTALKAAYEAVNGQKPNLREGGGGTTPTGAFYRDRAEWLADINKPEYRTSEAFRNEVLMKLRNSPNV